MGAKITVIVIYAFAQIIYYIRKKYIKEIFISLVFIFISAMYLIAPDMELSLPTISDIVNFIFRPVAEFIFEIKE